MKKKLGRGRAVALRVHLKASVGVLSPDIVPHVTARARGSREARRKGTEMCLFAAGKIAASRRADLPEASSICS